MEGRKQMRLAVKLLAVLCIASLVAVAAPVFSVTFNGPNLSPNEGGSSFPTNEGACASVSTPGCIISGSSPPIAFDPVTVTITENTPGNWSYTETTYTPNSLATFGPQAFGDALFLDTKTNTYWGVSLDSNLDLLTQGDLYYAGTVAEGLSSAFVTPNVLGYTTGGNDPVLINNGNANANNIGGGLLPGLAGTSSSFGIVTNACFDSSGNLLGGNTNLTVNATSTCAPFISNPAYGQGYSEYTITDTFNVNSPYAFLGATDPFEFEVASYVCSNGVILGSSTGATVPEPRGVVFMGAALLLLAGCIKRLRTKTA